MKGLSYIIYSLFFLFGCARKGNESSAQNPIVYKDSSVTRFFQRTTGCIAGDGGFTVPLSNGKVLWLMGDSHIDDYDPSSKTVPCLFQVRNAALLQPAGDWNYPHTTTLTGNSAGLKSFLKNNNNDTFFCWPGAGVQIGDTAYIYCASLKNQGSGAFGFAPAGNDFLAKINIPEMAIAGYRELPSFNGISFGVGFIKDDKNKRLYVYGQKYVASKIECELYVACCPMDGIGSEWKYWDGAHWNSNVVNAKAIAVQSGVSGTFQVAKVKERIVLLSSELSINCDSGTEIYIASTSGFTGPFTDKKNIYAITERLDGHSPFFYAAIAHPEYINEKDELLITYAINGYGTCVPDCRNNRMDPDVYRLRGIRVPCALIGK
jgi:hypothetical protein